MMMPQGNGHERVSKFSFPSMDSRLLVCRAYFCKRQLLLQFVLDPLIFHKMTGLHNIPCISQVCFVWPGIIVPLKWIDILCHLSSVSVWLADE